MGHQGYAFRQAISWDDAFKQVQGGNPYIAGEIADSRDRHLEEYLRKHVVTTSNEAGDIITGTGQAIQSENFVTGTTGWQIAGDGTVEFESGFFRGDISGADGAFSGTISASNITSGTMTADYISGGTISGDLISGGTITGTSININSGAFQVTSGGVVTATSGTFTGTVNATTGTLTDLTVNGDLTMTVDGTIRTASSGHRAMLGPSTYSLYSEDFLGLTFQTNAGHTNPGLVVASDSVLAEPMLFIRSGYDTGDVPASLNLRSATTGSNAQLFATGVSLGDGASGVGTIQLDGTVTIASNNDLICTGGGTFEGELTTDGGLLRVAKSSSGELLRLVYKGSANQGGWISFHDISESDRLGYMGFIGNDDLWINNEEAGGHIYIDAGVNANLSIRSGGNIRFTTNDAGSGKMGFYLGTDSDSGMWSLAGDDITWNVGGQRGWRLVESGGTVSHYSQTGAGVGNWSNSGTAYQAAHIDSSNGHLFRYTSSRRYKKNIRRHDLLADVGILPRIGHQFRVKKAYQLHPEEDDPYIFGPIAEELAAIHPSLVTHDEEGPEAPLDIVMITALWDRVAQLEETLYA